MKIAFILDYWLGSKGGGVLSFNKNLVERMESSGHEVAVLFRQGLDKLRMKMPEDKYSFAAEARNALVSINPDVIICQDGWFLAMPAAKFTSKDAVRLVIFHTHFDKRLPFVKSLAYNRILAKFDAACFVSKGLKDNVRQVAGIHVKRGYVLNPGISLEGTPISDGTSFRARFGVPSGTPLVLMHAGTIYGPKAKGAKVLIDSIALVKKKHPQVRLAITREGPHLNVLRDHAISVGLSNNVIFTGDLENPLDAMSAADIYAHISFGDGYPLSILEAMALGKPVVASNMPGIDEAVENGRTGILVANSPEIVAEQLLRLLDDREESRKLGEAGRKFVIENRSWRSVESELLKIISECRAMKPSGGEK